MNPSTHEVLNQVDDLVQVDAATGDPLVRFALAEYDADWAAPKVDALAREVWSPRLLQAARQSHRYPPELRVFDRTGHVVNEVDFHPAYHQLMDTAFTHGVHALSWAMPGPGAHVARAAECRQDLWPHRLHEFWPHLAIGFGVGSGVRRRCLAAGR